MAGVKKAARTRSGTGAGTDPAARPKAGPEGGSSEQASSADSSSAEGSSSHPGVHAWKDAHAAAGAAAGPDASDPSVTSPGFSGYLQLHELPAATKDQLESTLVEIEGMAAAVRSELASRPPAPAGPVLRIVSKVEGFRRAGVPHSKAATDHPVNRFDEAQLAQLVGDPNLTVTAVMSDGEVIPMILEDGRPTLEGFGAKTQE